MGLPLSQVSNLLPVGCFIVICYQSYFGGVVHKLERSVHPNFVKMSRFTAMSTNKISFMVIL